MKLRCKVKLRSIQKQSHHIISWNVQIIEVEEPKFLILWSLTGIVLTNCQWNDVSQARPLCMMISVWWPHLLAGYSYLCCRKYISDEHQTSLPKWQKSMSQGGSFICQHRAAASWRSLKWISLPASNLLYPIAQLPFYYLEKIKASDCLKIGRYL